MSSTGSIPPQGRRQTQRRGVDHVLGYSRRAFSKKAVNTEKVVVNEQLSEPCEAFGDPHLLLARSESQRTWRPRNYATRRNIMMRASIKRSLAARRHRAKIVVCKGGEDTRSAATTGAGASLRRDVVHDLTATRTLSILVARRGSERPAERRGQRSWDRCERPYRHARGYRYRRPPSAAREVRGIDQLQFEYSGGKHDLQRICSSPVRPRVPGARGQQPAVWRVGSDQRIRSVSLFMASRQQTR